MITRIPQNSILVELEKISDNEYKLASGHTLFLNTTYKPENHVRIYGKCVAIPDALHKGDLAKWEEGDYRHISSIVPEVQIGDTVYFSYVAVNRHNLLEWEGKSYYSVNYSKILCTVREGKIIPIGGNIMCEEYYGADAEPIEVEGRKMYGIVSKSGFISEILHKPLEQYATVKIIGTPLKEDSDTGLKEGNVVVFKKKMSFKNNIEGKDYLFLKYWDIQAVIE